ncbi:hypothetical protein A2715_01075 [Candidatus Woesebacteria bacterium RIFCSPHIGHO2_01_FULL_39_32]|uniref:Uncharacterized protein n=2 Tax=Candidatus Woeseibacteriota TaxID=1752722 RepID=A0A0G0SXQ1_9BACT|nr:MAG: hypothetical protein UT61_C0008G0038 [Candidatus Woesebacteria bacterium GW2011_GWA1_39_8]OGM24499.1 MAG: hypothetical protein A2715_01075 [Candidatus Woesebacteria bacterium RIFCSPHIGHO2_01_FULL_39_32]OGM38871.1 MAG: hypothetical protein A3F01_03790 [Candidatus Woesebacteria bacterium RIFCSPHIGHO2_12_FULL_38_11]OGM63805.1 MAG: hypothetical protein A2893_02410 [Candidatus Woesebacteria bacterium RIFCSPLOWO2_01_FULL_39_25]
MNKNSKGFAHFFLVVVIVVIGIGGLLYYSWQRGLIKTKPNQEISPTPTVSSNETADWKTYINSDYGFQFSFPPNLAANHDIKEEQYYDNLVEMLFESQQIFVRAIQNVDIYQEAEPEMVANREFSDSGFEYGVKSEKIANSPAAVIKTKDEDYFAAIISHPLKENVFIQISTNLGSNTFEQVISTFKFLPKQSDWRVYKNGKYGFEVKYPGNFFFEESGGSNYPPFEFSVRFAENQYEEAEYNYPDISIIVIDSPLSPRDFLNENGSEDSVIEEKKVDKDYLYYGVGNRKEIKINNLDALQFESLAVSTGTIHTMFKKGGFIFDVTNRLTGVGEVPKEIYNQVLSTFKFVE